MTRILFVLAALAVLSLLIRGALIAASKSKPGPGPRRNPSLPPDRLVCGMCGETYDPEQSGWTCPKCKK
jgi:hypothetical protein